MYFDAFPTTNQPRKFVNETKIKEKENNLEKKNYLWTKTDWFIDTDSKQEAPVLKQKRKRRKRNLANETKQRNSVKNFDYFSHANFDTILL